MNKKKLEWTGERLTTELESVYGVIEHLHRYAIAQQIVKNKIVLDIASGEGYGSHLLSKFAFKTYGVDIDAKSVAHANEKYANENLNFIVGSTDLIPLEDNSIDLVVSFETIEHHNKHDLMIQEIKRVLKKDGVLLISSPEKSIYSERDANNPFHVKEITLDEFEVLLKKYFNKIYLLQQRFVTGSLISLIDNNIKSSFNTFDGDFDTIYPFLKQEDFYNKPYFNLAICSNENINIQSEIGNSLFNGFEVTKRQLKSVNDKYEMVLNSYSFKFGNSIFKKLKYFKKIWTR